jgi:hypothetical protein
MAKKSAHYVDNKKFSAAVIEYTVQAEKAEEAGLPIPQMSDYIGKSMLDLCEGISRKPNFIRYTYRDEMVGSAIERCFKSIMNFNKNAATRGGKPNAHAYFSQCAYWTMVQYIQAQEKEVDFRLTLITNSGLDSFVAPGDSDTIAAAQNYVDSLRASAGDYQENKAKSKTKHYGWTSPPGGDQRKAKKVVKPKPAPDPSGLENFMDNES